MAKMGRPTKPAGEHKIARSICLDGAMWARVDAQCLHEGESRSALVERAIMDYLIRKEHQ
jgi:metal-responsive CopG/Arc/MetJ family transcriptional regulator